MHIVNKQNPDLPQTPIYRKPRFNMHIVNKQNPDLPQTPIYRKPRFNMHIVNKQYPNLPRTPIYRRCLLSPKTRGKTGFYFIFYIVNEEVAYIHTALLGWNLETQKHLMTLFYISVLLSIFPCRSKRDL